MVFVSHATADNDRVDQLAARLKAAGLDLWIDHQHSADAGLGAGDEWQREIQSATNDCDACIYVITPESVKSRWCEAEWTRFLELKKPVYPLLLDPVALADFPLRLCASVSSNILT
jgi:hypothetical protein